MWRRGCVCVALVWKWPNCNCYFIIIYLVILLLLVEELVVVLLPRISFRINYKYHFIFFFFYLGLLLFYFFFLPFYFPHLLLIWLIKPRWPISSLFPNCLCSALFPFCYLDWVSSPSLPSLFFSCKWLETCYLRIILANFDLDVFDRFAMP